MKDNTNIAVDAFLKTVYVMGYGQILFFGTIVRANFIRFVDGLPSILEWLYPDLFHCSHFAFSLGDSGNKEWEIHKELLSSFLAPAHGSVGIFCIYGCSVYS
jgi:hypothetical protein